LDAAAHHNVATQTRTPFLSNNNYRSLVKLMADFFKVEKIKRDDGTTWRLLPPTALSSNQTESDLNYGNGAIDLVKLQSVAHNVMRVCTQRVQPSQTVEDTIILLDCATLMFKACGERDANSYKKLKNENASFDSLMLSLLPDDNALVMLGKRFAGEVSLKQLQSAAISSNGNYAEAEAAVRLSIELQVSSQQHKDGYNLMWHQYALSMITNIFEAFSHNVTSDFAPDMKLQNVGRLKKNPSQRPSANAAGKAFIAFDTAVTTLLKQFVRCSFGGLDCSDRRCAIGSHTCV
jgi:hypothetical protein